MTVSPTARLEGGPVHYDSKVAAKWGADSHVEQYSAFA